MTGDLEGGCLRFEGGPLGAFARDPDQGASLGVELGQGCEQDVEPLAADHRHFHIPVFELGRQQRDRLVDDVAVEAAAEAAVRGDDDEIYLAVVVALQEGMFFALGAQGDAYAFLGGQPQRLVAAVGVQTLRATQHGRQGLQCYAHHVVLRLLRGQRAASRLCVEAQH